MKQTKLSLSPTLTEINQHYDDEYERFAAGMDKAFAAMRRFPYGHRGPVFIWLWENHAGVVHAMERHWLAWDTIAMIATEDGIKGRWGEPPTGNAMRRVWGRVCQEKESRAARKGS
jgi:hypothetical protein